MFHLIHLLIRFLSLLGSDLPHIQIFDPSLYLLFVI